MRLVEDLLVVAVVALLVHPIGLARAASPAASITQYMFGKSKIILPSGQVVSEPSSLIKRKVWPDQNLIMEDVVGIDPRPGVRPHHFIVLMRVAGSKIAMAELNDAFTGHGELVGEPGKWTAWNTVSNLPDGSTLESRDQLTNEGLVVKKVMKNAAGKVTMTIEELFPLITEAEYRKQFDALYPGCAEESPKAKK